MSGETKKANGSRSPACGVGFFGIFIETFILDNIEPDSMIATDGWKSYNIIESNPYGHDKTKQSATKDNNKLYGVHLSH